MPEAPQPIDVMDSLDRDEPLEPLDAKKEVEQGQDDLKNDTEHTLGQTMRLSINPEINETLQRKGMENLLKYVSARAVLETRGAEGLANKFSVRGKIGNIFKL